MPSNMLINNRFAYTLLVGDVITERAYYGSAEVFIASENVFDPASLFANGEQGAFYDPSDLSTLFQDDAGTTPVTEPGQTVGLMLDKSGNDNHATQPTAESRPVYQAGGGLHWLEFDGVDDIITTDLDAFGVFDYCMSYTPQGNNFMVSHRRHNSSGGWVGIGQEGSTSTSLDDAVGAQNAFYVDNQKLQSQTRGDQYTGAQNGNTAIVNYEITNNRSDYVGVSIGFSSAAFSAPPGIVHGWLLRQGTLGEAQRELLTDFLANRAGVAL